MRRVEKLVFVPHAPEYYEVQKQMGRGFYHFKNYLTRLNIGIETGRGWLLFILFPLSSAKCPGSNNSLISLTAAVTHRYLYSLGGSRGRKKSRMVSSLSARRLIKDACKAGPFRQVGELTPTENSRANHLADFSSSAIRKKSWSRGSSKRRCRPRRKPEGCNGSRLRL